MCRPAHALYFVTYEVAKKRLGVQRSGHATVASATAGAIATIVNDALMTPGDVVEQRLQLANSPYNGMVDCIVKTYLSEGIRAFFRSYKLTVWCTTHACCCWAVKVLCLECCHVIELLLLACCGLMR